MLIHFYKYQGTGNDFVIIDNRSAGLLLNAKQINHLCDRRFGIGADGLMILSKHPQLDFAMEYYNADGNESTMCGNGGRCLVAFARKLKIVDNTASFMAVDGQHKAVLNSADWVKLKMSDVEGIETGDDYFYLNTGSPHYVTFVEKTENLDVYKLGKNIRYNDRFREEGTNVNFVELINEESFNIRTYERGVEDETLSCGTGSVASAICAGLKLKTDTNAFTVHTRGGDLRVSFEKTGDQLFKEIWLEGPANFVFEGDITI